MNDHYVSKRDLYSYEVGEKLARYILLPFVIITAGTALLTIFGTAKCLILALEGGSADCQLVWIPIIMFLFVAPLCAIFLNMYPDIRTSNDGLAVQVFLFWWSFVPWEDVVDIHPTMASKLLGGRSRLIVVRRLTLIHRLIGGWETKYQPAFIVRRTMKGYTELVKLVETKLGK